MSKPRGFGLLGGVALAAALVFGLVLFALRRPLAEGFGAPSAMTYGPVGVPAGFAARIVLHPLLGGFREPVDLQFVPGLPGAVIVLEKAGRARFVRLPSSAEAAAAEPPEVASGVDVVSLDVHSASELGLLGLAFHPRYGENGLFYLNDNPRDGGALRTRISEWRLLPRDLGRAPAELVRVLLEIDQPYRNHDGGQLAFGPDGYLYIGMGDGGHRADPQGHGQNLGSLLGKMLRIDVDARPRYAIPKDNPFAGKPGVRPEIWAYGLRNPWRFSFDPKGRLIAADVGQDAFEEIDFVGAGENLGWSVREAAHCFSPPTDCPSSGLVAPIFEYGRSDGSSVTGGHVYLGTDIEWLQGKYLFADFVSGQVWALALPERTGERASAESLGRFPHAISAFGRDTSGEIYALDFTRGLLLRLRAASD